MSLARDHGRAFFLKASARAAVVFGFLFLVGCASPRPRDTPGIWISSTLGLCEDYPEESRSLERARTDLATARSSGAKVLRIAFGWDAMEPQPGRYDWSFWDEFVRLAVNDHRLRLIPYVCYTPKWAASDGGDNFWRSPPRDPQDFARFMSALVTRYRHAIHSWELWNEPDNAAYWLGTPAQFAALVHAGSAAVRQADPRATIVLGGIATETEFLETLFETHAIAPAVDVVNLHSYFETWHPDPIETLPSYVERAAEIVRDHGENEPLWLAETGYSSVGGRVNVSSVYRARVQGEHTEHAQAVALARTTILALATGRLPLVAWYRINDLPPKEDIIGDDNNRHLGIRTVNAQPKPALTVFTRLAREFHQPYRIVTPTVNAIAGNVSAEVRAFALSNGQHVVAAWLHAPEISTTAEPPPDRRHARVTIGLPNVQAREVVFTNALGDPLPTGRAAWKNNSVTLQLDLSLHGSDFFFAKIHP